MLAACGPTVAVPSDDTGGGTGESTTAGTSSASTVTTVPGTTTATTVTTTPPDDTTSMATFSSAGPTSGSDDRGSFTTEIISDTSDPGIVCMSNEECESGFCYLAGILGGICSECLTDEHCEWGCSGPNPLADPPMGATCSDGGLGGGCMTDAACMDPLLCGLAIDVPGVLSVSTCGDCLVDGDCSGDQVCSPNVFIDEVRGQLECVEPNSEPNGSFCDLSKSGAECASGLCGAADIMGLVQFGICGPCSNFDEDDEGCLPGETCQDPMVDLSGEVVPSLCV